MYTPQCGNTSLGSGSGVSKKTKKRGETPMKVKISVPEVVKIFKEIQAQPERIFDMVRVDIRESVGEYLSKMMEMELTHFLGRDRYERGQGDVNDRNFTLKGIGEVRVEVPRDRKGEFEIFKEQSAIDTGLRRLPPPPHKCKRKVKHLLDTQD
jgi:hypothetical protein